MPLQCPTANEIRLPKTNCWPSLPGRITRNCQKKKQLQIIRSNNKKHHNNNEKKMNWRRKGRGFYCRCRGGEGASASGVLWGHSPLRSPRRAAPSALRQTTCRSPAFETGDQVVSWESTAFGHWGIALGIDTSPNFQLQSFKAEMRGRSRGRKKRGRARVFRRIGGDAEETRRRRTKRMWHKRKRPVKTEVGGDRSWLQ